jgi:hypothetical protein
MSAEVAAAANVGRLQRTRVIFAALVLVLGVGGALVRAPSKWRDVGFMRLPGRGWQAAGQGRGRYVVALWRGWGGRPAAARRWPGVAQAGHHAGEAAGARGGGVLGVGDVAEVVQCLDAPMPAQPAGQAGGACLVDVKAGDRVHGEMRQRRLAAWRTRRVTPIAWAACGNHRPATVATFEGRDLDAAMGVLAGASSTGSCRHGSLASWAWGAGWLALTTSR